MKILFTIFLIGFVVSIQINGKADLHLFSETFRRTVETIVCIRHGEKPLDGLGQLTCRGLNRALALPNVLLTKYGTPRFIFAPNPAQKGDRKADGSGGYYYVRPLMTIEPTAIHCGLPVNTQFGDLQIKSLKNELLKPKYQNATVFLAWEHVMLDKFIKNILKSNGGNPAQVPAWPENDYDTIFVVRIIHSEKGESATFTIDHEGLNNLSEVCP